MRDNNQDIGNSDNDDCGRKIFGKTVGQKCRHDTERRNLRRNLHLSEAEPRLYNHHRQKDYHSHLRKLGRLEGNASDIDPAAGAVDRSSDEPGRDQQNV